MNGNSARLLELKAENQKLHRDLVLLKRTVRALSVRLKAITAELEALTGEDG